MNKLKSLICLAGLLLLQIPGVVQAQTTENNQQYAVKAGAYYFLLTIEGQRLKTSNDIPFNLVFDPKNSLPVFDNKSVSLSILANPGEKTSATPVKVKIGPSQVDPRRWDGTLNLPVSGDWILKISVKGIGGNSEATLPVIIAPPPAMPWWLAWTIGLIPAVLILGFFGLQYWRTRDKIKAEMAF